MRTFLLTDFMLSNALGITPNPRHCIFVDCAGNGFTEGDLSIRSKRSIVNIMGENLPQSMHEQILTVLKANMQQDGYPLTWEGARDWLQTNG